MKDNVQVLTIGPLPTYQSPDATGADLIVSDGGLLKPGHWKAFSTGLFVCIPKGYEGQVRPRSGLAAKTGITVLNAPGTIDSDYRGEIKVLLINLGPTSVMIENGTRIAQLVIAPVTHANFVRAQELPKTKRGTDGLGSTGM